MGILKDKSTENIESAQLLLNANASSSSVHCSYYSCIQLILDILHEDLNINEEELDDLFSEYRDENEGGLHNFYINKIVQELFTRDKNFKQVQDFSDTIRKLKKKRVDADYKRSQIGLKDGKKIMDRAVEIKKYLQTVDFKEEVNEN